VFNTKVREWSTLAKYKQWQFQISSFQVYPTNFWFMWRMSMITSTLSKGWRTQLLMCWGNKSGFNFKKVRDNHLVISMRYQELIWKYTALWSLKVRKGNLEDLNLNILSQKKVYLMTNLINKFNRKFSKL